MKTSNQSARRANRVSSPSARVAGVVPVTQLCEICCLVLCRIVVPKLARGMDIAG